MSWRENRLRNGRGEGVWTQLMAKALAAGMALWRLAGARRRSSASALASQRRSTWHAAASANGMKMSIWLFSINRFAALSTAHAALACAALLNIDVRMLAYIDIGGYSAYRPADGVM